MAEYTSGSAGDSRDRTEALIRRARGGDGAAENALFVRYTDRVLRLVRRRLRPPLREEVESMDVVQDALIDAHAGLGRFQTRGNGSFARWIRRIVDRKVLEAFRYRFSACRTPVREAPLDTRQARPAHRATPDDPADLAVTKEAAEQLIRLFGTLPAAQRQALVLHYFRGLDLDQMSCSMGRSKDACRVLVARALASLQQLAGRAGRKGSRPS